MSCDIDVVGGREEKVTAVRNTRVCKQSRAAPVGHSLRGAVLNWSVGTVRNQTGHHARLQIMAAATGKATMRLHMSKSG